MKLDLKKFQTTENKIGVLIIIGVFLFWDIIILEFPEMTRWLLRGFTGSFLYIMILPGAISALLYTMFTKSKIKIFGIGILTIVLCFVRIIISALSYKAH